MNKHELHYYESAYFLNKKSNSNDRKTLVKQNKIKAFCQKMSHETKLNKQFSANKSIQNKCDINAN